MKKEKCIVLGVLSLSFIVSCTPPKMIGQVNMISNRNISTTFDYEQLSTYSYSGRLSKPKAKTIQEAIDQTVKDVPGGEFIMNAKIYTKDMCYVVVGDVWGHGTNVGYGEFVRGDSVIWKGTGSTNYNKNGKIVAFKDQTTAIVEEDGGKRTEIKIKNLIKSE